MAVGPRELSAWTHAAAGVILCSLTIPLILVPTLGEGPDRYDERTFHLPQIRKYQAELPTPDVSDSSSQVPSTPLFHLLMAGVSKASGCERCVLALRFVNLTISLIVVWLVLSYLGTGWDRSKAFLATLPFIVSPYFTGPASSLVNDNLALLFVLLTLYLLDPRAQAFRSPASSVMATGAVLTRQVYAWLVPIGLLWGSRSDDPAKGILQRAAWVLLPTSVLVYFLILWGGVVPPCCLHLYPNQVDGSLLPFEPVVVVYILGLLGLYGMFFAPWYKRIAMMAGRPGPELLIPITVVVTALSVHPVGYSEKLASAGEGGMLWLASRALPPMLSSAPVFWLFCPIGALILWIIARDARTTGDYFMLAVILFWIAANALNGRTVQKYYDPFVLFILAYPLRRVIDEPRAYWVGPMLLILGLLLSHVVRFG